MNLDNFNFSNIENKTFYDGANMIITEIERSNGELITRDNMKELCNNFKDHYLDQYGDGLVSISIEYPNRWYSSNQISHLGDDISYFHADQYEEFDDDPEEYSKFRFVFLPIGPRLAAGGKDPNNDCLITCLKRFINSKDKFYVLADELKELLGLERDEMIPISVMAEVEKYFNRKLKTNIPFAIYISGDHAYTSVLKTNKKINLILSNGHYSIDETKIIKPKLLSRDEKPILMVDFVKDKIQAFDGKDYSVITHEEYDDYKFKPITSPNIIVHKGFNATTKKLDYSIEDAYQDYITMADDLKTKLKGKFNFYKCGSIKQMALNTFFKLTMSIQPEKISHHESQWIEDASFTALTYWENFKGTVYAYDVNSRYPSVMVKNTHYFPIKEGTYHQIAEFSRDHKANVIYGLYRCRIFKNTSKQYKFFEFNKYNMYTHLDINVAFDYGLKVELIQDTKANCLLYNSLDVVNGAHLFGSYINPIYELKKEKVKGSKDLLNTLWGGLCQSNEKSYSNNPDDEHHINEAKITSMHIDDSKIRISCIFHKQSRLYKTDYARIKPFILSYGRVCMYWRYKQYESDIVRMHTDGFYLKNKPEKIQTGTELGHLKYEGTKIVDITGINKLGQKKL